MSSLPEAIITVLRPFAVLFSRPVWTHVQVLRIGAILCRGPRTVAAVLRIMGLGQEKRFEKYHRVLSRASWSGLQGGKILLGLLVPLLPATWPIIVGTDETMERRRGKKIAAKGCYRDAVRATEKHVVTCFGLKWLPMMLLVPLPWSARPWTLPFLTVLAPSARAHAAVGKRHKTTIDWTIQMVKVVSRWLGGRRWGLVGDGGYACVKRARTCKAFGVTLVSRLRLDAQLPALPGPVPAGKRGRKPKKGPRLPHLWTRVDAPTPGWQTVEVAWYGGEVKRMRLRTDVCLWYTPGEDPVPIRWVLVVDPAGKLRPSAFFSTGVTPDLGVPSSRASSATAVSQPTASPPVPLEVMMKQHIEAALAATHGRVEGPHGAARLLQINPHILCVVECASWASIGASFAAR